MTKRRFRSGASALLLVLWAILVLSGALFVWARAIDQDISRLSAASNGLDAMACARSGLAVALHPKVRPESPILEYEWSSGLAYSVRMVSEGGKLHLNWLLEGEDPVRLEILKRYLERRKVGFQERQVLVDCMLDWVDPDETTHLNGRETEPDYRPANRPFSTVAELAQVHGAETLVSQPGWEDDFTIFTQGPLDVLAASMDILAVLPGVGDARAIRFVQFRDGPDKKVGTKDDHAFRGGMPEVFSLLGLVGEQRSALEGLVTMRDPTVFIESTGMAGKVIRQITVVARKGDASPIILQWKEK